MKVNQVRTLGSRIALFAAPIATLALGFSLQACGGAGPDGEPTTASEPSEKTGQTAQDLSIFGIEIPQPTVTIGLGDASVKIDPIGTIDTLIPEQGIAIPDPIKPVDQLLGDLGKGVSASVNVGDIGVGIKLPGIELPQLPDPFGDGGIELIGR